MLKLECRRRVPKRVVTTLDLMLVAESTAAEVLDQGKNPRDNLGVA